MTKFYDTVTEKLATWVDGFAATLPNLVAALFIVTVFFLVSRPTSKLVSRAVGRVSDSDVITGLSERLARFGVLWWACSSLSVSSASTRR